MPVFSALSRCADLTPEIAKLAARSSADARALLERLAAIARPNDGAPRILLALARLAGQPWLEGRLRVEISGDAALTTINVFDELGVGILERIFPTTRLAVPFEELTRAIETTPEMVLPLRVTDDANKLILTPLLGPEESIDPTAPAFELDERSLGDADRTTAPPPAAVPIEAKALVDAAKSAPLPSAPPPSTNVHNRPTVPRVNPASEPKIPAPRGGRNGPD